MGEREGGQVSFGNESSLPVSGKLNLLALFLQLKDFAKEISAYN